MTECLCSQILKSVLIILNENISFIDSKEYNEFEAISKELSNNLVLSICEEDVEMGNDIFELFDIDKTMLP